MDKIANHGQLIVISGPNGVGKRTVIERYLDEHPNAMQCTSVTTREKKDHEIDGVEHWFVSVDEFNRAVRTNQMLAYNYYNNHAYGTTRKAVEEARSAGHNVIIIEDVVGAMKIRALCPDATLIYLVSPDWDILEERIRIRHKGKTEEQIQAYLDEAREQISCAGQYDYILINDTVDKTVRRLGQIIHGNRYSKNSMAEFIHDYIEDVGSGEFFELIK